MADESDYVHLPMDLVAEERVGQLDMRVRINLTRILVW